MGRSPQEIDDQITYPLSVNLQGLAGVKAVRVDREFNFSMINIIFDDKIDFYFARTRVLERLSIARTFLPAGVAPYLAPDATALGQIFWYTVEGDGQRLDELRAIQDWYVRYQLTPCPAWPRWPASAASSASTRSMSIPSKLRAYDLPLGAGRTTPSPAATSPSAARSSSRTNAEYLIRGVGWLRGLRRHRERRRRRARTACRSTSRNVADRAARRRSSAAASLEKNGREAVGGVVHDALRREPARRSRERIKEQDRASCSPACPRACASCPSTTARG